MAPVPAGENPPGPATPAREAATASPHAPTRSAWGPPDSPWNQRSVFSAFKPLLGLDRGAVGERGPRDCPRHCAAVTLRVRCSSTGSLTVRLRQAAAHSGSAAENAPPPSPADSIRGFAAPGIPWARVVVLAPTIAPEAFSLGPELGSRVLGPGAIRLKAGPQRPPGKPSGHGMFLARNVVNHCRGSTCGLYRRPPPGPAAWPPPPRHRLMVAGEQRADPGAWAAPGEFHAARRAGREPPAASHGVTWRRLRGSRRWSSGRVPDAAGVARRPSVPWATEKSGPRPASESAWPWLTRNPGTWGHSASAGRPAQRSTHGAGSAEESATTCCSGRQARVAAAPASLRRRPAHQPVSRTAEALGDPRPTPSGGDEIPCPCRCPPDSCPRPAGRRHGSRGQLAPDNGPSALDESDGRRPQGAREGRPQQDGQA